MKELKEQIKQGRIEGPYLFYGEEKYLIHLYLDRIRRALMSEEDEIMNYSLVDSPRTADEISEALQTLPFMLEKRLTVIKNSGAFQIGEDFSFLETLLKETNNTVVAVFWEEKVDKRSRMYKYFGKAGKIVEFDQQAPEDLAKWIRKEVQQKGKSLHEETARFLIEYVGRDMTRIAEELEKLNSLTADKPSISKEDIQSICSMNVEENVFAMTDQIANKKAPAALKIFSELLSANTPAQKIYYMIIRQFRQLLRAVVLSEEGKSSAEIAKVLGIPPYPAQACIRQGKRFGKKQIEMILQELLEMDFSAKNGNLDAADACMMIIVKYAA